MFEEFSSDHLGVSFKVSLPGVTQAKARKREIWDFKEANSGKFKELATKELKQWRGEARCAGDLDEFCCIVLGVALKTILKKWIDENATPKVSRAVMKLRRQRKRAVKVKRRIDTPMIRERISEIGKLIGKELKKELETKAETFLLLPQGSKS